MPHQCTNCGHTFPDGSKEMLSGCPDCGGNKFQFKPAGSRTDDAPQSTSTPDSSRSNPATADPSTQQPSAPESSQSPSESAESPPETEGVTDDSGFVSKTPKNADESPAQSSARSEVVSSSEFTAVGSNPPSATDDTESTADQPVDSKPETPAESASSSETDNAVDEGESDESNLDQLRKELNNQFESIRIVSPGQYELNLMELYDREEYIISLREDGRYVIEVPDGWGDS